MVGEESTSRIGGGNPSVHDPYIPYRGEGKGARPGQATVRNLDPGWEWVRPGRGKGEGKGQEEKPEKEEGEEKEDMGK